MIGKKIIEERPITASEARKILEEREKKGELNYEQKTALDHLSKFVKLKPEKAREALEELSKLDKIKPETGVKIVDTLPENEEDIRAIFAKERYVLTKEEMGKILKAIEGLK